MIFKAIRDEWNRDVHTDGEEVYHRFDGGLFLSDEQLADEGQLCDVCEQPIKEYGTKTECLSCYTNSCDRLYDEARDREILNG